MIFIHYKMVLGFSEINTGLCPEQVECDTGCATEYNPVCGSNSFETRTFPSRCSLGVYNCVQKTGNYVILIFKLSTLLTRKLIIKLEII